MILDAFFIYFLLIILPEVHMSETIENVFVQGLERRHRRESLEDRERDLSAFEHRPVTCEKRYHTENTPYIAVILSKTSGNFLCMGSIVGSQTVLTVRECLMRDDMHDILVMGGYMGAWWGKDAQVKHVDEIVKSDDDLAILKLTQKFIFTKTVTPIKLSNANPLAPHTIYGTEYGVVGFVRAAWDVPGEPMPKTSHYEMKYATLMTGSESEKCFDIYRDVNVNETTMFCTYANTSFCWGNLGSPTVVVKNGQLTQMGIVVRAFCDERYNPNLHLRIDAFENWIRSNSEARQIPADKKTQHKR